MNSTAEQSSLSYFLQREDKFNSKLSPRGDLICGIVHIFTGVVSFIGNGGSLAVFYNRRKQLSPAEVFLVNLGVVDVLLSITSYPFSMYSSFVHKWVFGATGCTIYGFVCYFLGLACLASLTAIAVIRFLKTCHPNIGNSINCSTAHKIIVGVYLYALLLAFLPLTGFGRYDVEVYGLSCTLDWSASGSWNQLYIVLVTILCVFLPTGIIVYCYSQIVLLVRKSDRLVGGTRVRRNISDIQLTWMSGSITLGFIVGWFPYTLVSLWGAFTDEMLFPMWASPIPVLMAKSSIAYNPIIYIFLTRRYREDFITLARSLMFRLLFCGQKMETSSDILMDLQTRKTSYNEQNASHTHFLQLSSTSFSPQGENGIQTVSTLKNECTIGTRNKGMYLTLDHYNSTYSGTNSTFSGTFSTTVVITNNENLIEESNTQTEPELIPMNKLDERETVTQFQDTTVQIKSGDLIMK